MHAEELPLSFTVGREGRKRSGAGRRGEGQSEGIGGRGCSGQKTLTKLIQGAGEEGEIEKQKLNWI